MIEGPHLNPVRIEIQRVRGNLFTIHTIIMDVIGMRIVLIDTYSRLAGICAGRMRMPGYP